MGTLTYGIEDRCIQIDDRVLEHVKVVVVSRLMANRAVVLSVHPERLDGPDQILLEPTSRIRFDFDHADRQEISPTALATMMSMVNEPDGVVVSDRMPGLP